jgi:hypothetical protein
MFTGVNSTKLKQEYISERNAYEFEIRVQKAIEAGGRITHINTCLEHVEYQYSGGNQCKNINYQNLFWAVVEYPN